jgi:hypothetical protein
MDLCNFVQHEKSVEIFCIALNWMNPPDNERKLFHAIIYMDRS